MSRGPLLAGAALAFLGCSGSVEGDPAAQASGAGSGGAASSTATTDVSAANVSSSSTASTGGGAQGGVGGASVLPPPQDEGMALVQQQCPEVAAEKHFCITYGWLTADRSVGALGVESGSLCLMGLPNGESYDSAESIGVVGTYLYGCNGNVWRMPLLGGAAELLPVECSQVVAHGEELLVVREDFSVTVDRYASIDALLAGTPDDTFLPEAGGRGFAVQGDTLWSCEQAVDYLYAWSLPGWVPGEAFAMPTDDPPVGVVQGLDVSDDGLVLFQHPFGLYSIELATGAVVHEVDIQRADYGATWGLHCWTNP